MTGCAEFRALGTCEIRRIPQDRADLATGGRNFAKSGRIRRSGPAGRPVAAILGRPGLVGPPGDCPRRPGAVRAGPWLAAADVGGPWPRWAGFGPPAPGGDAVFEPGRGVLGPSGARNRSKSGQRRRNSRDRTAPDRPRGGPGRAVGGNRQQTGGKPGEKMSAYA